ncbi:unnamed protein product [Fusarium graminearum]|uniref:DUF6590 domain-containing protein n=1 Tax=Gibberella zeae TaxID=5518 RepID=A0A2H3FLI7_GIBZA|nr:hypothetical protein FG05_08482 [Fusarium graminearum]PCD20571.1 hypothetical protein FGRA07_04723 [Fusarium graminearum]CAF3461984.1 unnamed protein product [Fusarium graminearum]CAF3495080.1 unnamed protein product [Fusarium graminearum]CAG1960219.1 unnamed protein product [Fusarium graminearum]
MFRNYGYRIEKASSQRSDYGPRSAFDNKPVRNRPTKKKVKYFAHIHFTPSDPKRGPEKREAAWLQAEKLDAPALMSASIKEAADDWDCKGCSLKVRMLADKFNLKLHDELSATPTPQFTPSLGASDGHIDVNPPPLSSGEIYEGLSSFVSRNIEGHRRQTLERDAGDGQPFYGIHQAHFDLSRGESVKVHMRQSDRVYGRHDLTPGTIISAPFHSQYRYNTVSTDNHNTAVSAFGAIHSKYRKMVIIESWDEHVSCLPIYTYNGCGLASRLDMVSEYMDIRDADERNPLEGDTGEEPLLAVRDDEWFGKNTFIAGRSVVKLTERTAHMLFQKCSIEGRVKTAHFRRLYKELNKLIQAKALEFCP